MEIEDSLDKQFGFFVLKPPGVRFAEVSFRNYLVHWVIPYMAELGLGLDIAAVVSSRTQVWNIRGRASDDNQVKSGNQDQKPSGNACVCR